MLVLASCEESLKAAEPLKGQLLPPVALLVLHSSSIGLVGFGLREQFRGARLRERLFLVERLKVRPKK